MKPANLLRPFRDTRGVALMSAVIALTLLSALLIAFAVLSKSEPTIAGNQARSVQAWAMAESGLQGRICCVCASFGYRGEATEAVDRPESSAVRVLGRLVALPLGAGRSEPSRRLPIAMCPKARA